MKKMQIIIGFIVILAVVLLYELNRSNSSIEVEQITVTRTDLPDGFDGFRIAHLSDLHGMQHGKNNIELCELIRMENVDIVIITGDYVNSSADVGMVFATAMNLMEVAPVYYVPGNHEYGENYGNSYRDVKRELERAGVMVLQNQAVEIEHGGDKITVLGIDDPNGNADMLTMSETVALAKNRLPEFVLMLNHRYERAEEAAELGIPLMFTGHAHGGLVRLPLTDGLVGPNRVLFPKNTSGLYNVDGMSLVASRGLGNTPPSMRLFNSFHLPIVTLKKS